MSENLLYINDQSFEFNLIEDNIREIVRWSPFYTTPFRLLQPVIDRINSKTINCSNLENVISDQLNNPESLFYKFVDYFTRNSFPVLNRNNYKPILEDFKFRKRSFQTEIDSMLVVVKEKIMNMGEINNGELVLHKLSFNSNIIKTQMKKLTTFGSRDSIINFKLIIKRLISQKVLLDRQRLVKLIQRELKDIYLRL